MMSEEMLREKVMQLIGAASMCWEEPPHGVFDSERAVALGEAFIAALKETDDV